jgi:hypothetical protein
MFTITNQQVEAFRTARTEDFIRRAVHYMEERIDEGVAAEPLVRRGLERARAYHLQREVHVIRYISFMADFGIDFDRQDWARDILLHPRGDGDWVVDKLSIAATKAKNQLGHGR